MNNERRGVVGVNKYKVVKRNGKTRGAHRVIMEETLGRTLQHDEVVHHINGDRSDNRIENLELMRMPEHSQYHMRQLSNSSWVKRFKGAIGNRQPGHRNTEIKLNELSVRTIKERLKDCTNMAALGREFGVSKWMIYRIKSGDDWAWV
jgi:hypothetical protein